MKKPRAAAPARDRQPTRRELEQLTRSIGWRAFVEAVKPDRRRGSPRAQA
jgi:hypothetical protein